MTLLLKKEAQSVVLKKDDRKLLIRTVRETVSDMPPVTGNDGFAVIEVGSVAAFRAIKEGWVVPTFAIGTFAPVASVVEVGATVATPAFTASYNRTPDTATLKDGVNPDKDVTSTPAAFSSDETFVKTANNASQAFTLDAVEDGDPDSLGASILWQPRTFWGVDVDGLSTEADIEGLANSALDNNRNRTFTVTAGAGEHIYYAIPSSYGTPTFTIGGFEGGFVLEAAAVSVTNAEGVTQNYDLWKSVQPSLGATTVVVT